MGAVSLGGFRFGYNLGLLVVALGAKETHGSPQATGLCRCRPADWRAVSTRWSLSPEPDAVHGPCFHLNLYEQV